MRFDPKEYLKQIEYINDDINSRLREKNELRRAMAVRTSVITDIKVQESRSGRYDDKYMRYFEVAESIDERIDELVDLKMKISNEIDLIDDPLYRLVLRNRYINLLTFEDIASMLNKSIRYIYQVHGDALVDFKEKIEDTVITSL